MRRKFVLSRMMFLTQESEDVIRSIQLEERRYQKASMTTIESMSLKSCTEMIEYCGEKAIGTLRSRAARALNY